MGWQYLLGQQLYHANSRRTHLHQKAMVGSIRLAGARATLLLQEGVQIMIQATIEQQLTAKTCRCCARPVRPWQTKGVREFDFDLCAACWRKTPAGRAHKNSIRKSQSKYGDLRSNCQKCVHWLVTQERGRCTLDLPDRQPDCSYYMQG
jgi:hypothetical protein